MKFYYDINLNFNDTYINYFDWEEEEHFFRLPIFKIDNIRTILENKVLIETDYKDIIVSDGVTAIALELIDKQVAYYSSLEYKDELRVNELVAYLDNTLEIKVIDKLSIECVSNIDKRRKFYIDEINKNQEYFIKYLYYEITGKVSKSLNKMKKYLLDDINNNFNDKYYQIYDIINVGE